MVRIFAVFLVLSAMAEEHAPKSSLPQERMSPSTVERLKQFVQDACGVKRPGPPSRTPADPIAPPGGDRGPCDPIPGADKGTLGGPGHITGYFYNRKTHQCDVTRDYGSASSIGPFKSMEDCEKAVAEGKCNALLD